MELDREFYIVSEGKKWWTASKQADGWYIMTGDQHRIVQEDGRLGRKILASIEAFKREDG